MKYIITSLLFGFVTTILPGQSLTRGQIDNIHLQDKLYKKAFIEINNFPDLHFHLASEYPTFIGPERLDSVIWYDADNVEDLKSKTAYQYDLNGRHILTSTYSWLVSEQKWDPRNEFTYEYNLNNELAFVYRHVWDEELKIYERKYKSEYIYENDRLIRIDVFSINFQAAWDQLFRFHMIYEEEKLIKQVQYVFNDKNDLWYGFKNWTYTYDTAGKLKYSVQQELDLIRLDWMNLEEFVYEYNSNGDPYQIYVNQWYETLNLWYEDIKYELTYDLLVSAESYALPNGILETDHKIIRYDYLKFYLETETFNLNDKADYYYSDDLTSQENLVNNHISFYPNPGSDYLHLNGDWNEGLLEMYELSGKKVMCTKIEENMSVNISQIPNGTYLMVIQNSNGRSSGFFVKNDNR